MEIGDDVISDDDQVAETFNFFFTSITSNSTANIQDCLAEIDLNFQHVVRDLLAQLESKSSPGNVGIPVKVLKSTDTLVLLITNMINYCIDTNTIPVDWKSAVVTPLYKRKGKKSDINNFRGISVISPIAKIFEKVLAAQIVDFLADYNILSNHQHGFRTAHSCETALHELLSDLNEARDKSLVTLLLFIDFRKAFDLIRPEYFLDRHQAVKYNNIVSSNQDLELGVPQGSVLGPLLFSLYINDLPLAINELKSKLFADDTSLYKLHWCEYNMLDLNWSKTFFMFIKNKRTNYPSEIRIQNATVKVVDQFTLLGVTIDSKLNFITYIACKNSIF